MFIKVKSTNSKTHIINVRNINWASEISGKGGTRIAINGPHPQGYGVIDCINSLPDVENSINQALSTNSIVTVP